MDHPAPALLNVMARFKSRMGADRYWAKMAGTLWGQGLILGWVPPADRGDPTHKIHVVYLILTKRADCKVHCPFCLVSQVFCQQSQLNSFLLVHTYIHVTRYTHTHTNIHIHLHSWFTHTHTLGSHTHTHTLGLHIHIHIHATSRPWRVPEGTRLLDFQITTRTLPEKNYYSIE